jgi:hypothetical protein
MTRTELQAIEQTYSVEKQLSTYSTRGANKWRIIIRRKADGQLVAFSKTFKNVPVMIAEFEAEQIAA